MFLQRQSANHTSRALISYVYAIKTDVDICCVFTDSEDCDTCDEILEELETIDDDTDKHDIQFVKSKDSKLASDIGIFSFPALVYYETGVPIMYDGEFVFI